LTIASPEANISLVHCSQEEHPKKYSSQGERGLDNSVTRSKYFIIAQRA
jgi:hypothetical protein